MQDLLTVVIPTFNRPAELARLLTFQHELGTTFRTLILDGSDEGPGEENRRFASQFANVEHHKFPRDFHPVTRVARGVDLVRTPYLLMCGDDDFYFAEAVLECVRFLEAHPDYSAAMGKVWALRYFPQLPVVRRGVSLGDDLDHGDRFDHSRFIARAMHYFAYTFIGAVPLFYAVCRTHQAVERFAQLSESLKYTSDELLLVSFLLARGKFAKLPIPFGLRDYSSVTIRDPNRDGENSDLPAEDLAYVRPRLTALLMETEKLPHDQAEYLVDSLLLLWQEKSPVRPASPTATAIFLRRVGFCFECLGSQVVPGFMAKILGVTPQVYRALTRSHRKFTTRRRPVRISS